jgi:hypothetical protein
MIYVQYITNAPGIVCHHLFSAQSKKGEEVVCRTFRQPTDVLRAMLQEHTISFRFVRAIKIAAILYALLYAQTRCISIHSIFANVSIVEFEWTPEHFKFGYVQSYFGLAVRDARHEFGRLV